MFVRFFKAARLHLGCHNIREVHVRFSGCWGRLRARFMVQIANCDDLFVAVTSGNQIMLFSWPKTDKTISAAFSFFGDKT